MYLENIYSRPYRVYICFLLLIVTGLICYYTIPVALFPNSAKPAVSMWVPYDNYTRDGFLNTYGKTIESQLKRLRFKEREEEEVRANYWDNGVEFKIIFRWGNVPDKCLKEVQQILSYYQSQWPDSMRYASHAWLHQENIGFFLGNFYSEKRSAEDIYNILDNIIGPKIAGIKEANESVLYNPSESQITITLEPLKMSSFKLLPKTISTVVQNAIKSYSGGIIHNNEQTIIVEVVSEANIIEQLKEILIPIGEDKFIMLSEIAEINLQTNIVNPRMFKINGNQSVILFASPVVGENIKNMSQQILEIVYDSLKIDTVPSDIKFVPLINPGVFIKDATSKIMHEVWLCSFIAVVILFVFIGSFSGTLTTLLEIPISIMLSFILMKLTNVQVNLISLGGLALSVGMNVDASVVVIDAIIKNLGECINFEKNNIVKLVASAVRSVVVPVVLATITSLIVFVPLIFTSELTYAILGDLAKTIIYSHGLSLFIALILVPTVRVHIATSIGVFAEKHRIQTLELLLNKLYNFYSLSLQYFLNKELARSIVYTFIISSIIISFAFIPKRINKEIISPPDTKIIVSNLNYEGSSHISQIEEKIAEYEELLKSKYGKYIDFIFSDIYQKNQAASVMVLKNKSTFKKIFADLQELTKGSCTEVFL